MFWSVWKSEVIREKFSFPKLQSLKSPCKQTFSSEALTHTYWSTYTQGHPGPPTHTHLHRCLGYTRLCEQYLGFRRSGSEAQLCLSEAPAPPRLLSGADLEAGVVLALLPLGTAAGWMLKHLSRAKGRDSHTEWTLWLSGYKTETKLWLIWKKKILKLSFSTVSVSLS